MRIISRPDAAALKAIHYFTGKPCKYGHVARRFVSTGSCTACHSRDQQHARENKRLRAANMKRVPYFAMVPADMTDAEVSALFQVFNALVYAATIDRDVVPQIPTSR